MFLYPGMSPPVRISSYPYVVVRVACRFCGREGRFRLARLAVRFGPEAPMSEVLAGLAADCPWRTGAGRKTKSSPADCGAYLPDLDGSPRPPDMPPGTMPLRVIAGGKG